MIEDEGVPARAAKIAAAFRKLEFEDDRSGVISQSFFLEFYSEELARMRPRIKERSVSIKMRCCNLDEDHEKEFVRDASFYAAYNPKLQVSRATAEKQIENVARLADKLNEAINRLSRTAELSLCGGNPYQLISDVKLNLCDLWDATISADFSNVPDNSGMGAPPKNDARQVAWLVALFYYRLTGKNPTVSADEGTSYGPFLGLLEEIYSILDYPASADAQGRAVASEWKEHGVGDMPPADREGWVRSLVGRKLRH